jgi:hypothetical protein
LTDLKPLSLQFAEAAAKWGSANALRVGTGIGDLAPEIALNNPKGRSDEAQ